MGVAVLLAPFARAAHTSSGAARRHAAHAVRGISARKARRRRWSASRGPSQMLPTSQPPMGAPPPTLAFTAPPVASSKRGARRAASHPHGALVRARSVRLRDTKTTRARPRARRANAARTAFLGRRPPSRAQRAASHSPLSSLPKRDASYARVASRATSEPLRPSPARRVVSVRRQVKQAASAQAHVSPGITATRAARATRLASALLGASILTWPARAQPRASQVPGGCTAPFRAQATPSNALQGRISDSRVEQVVICAWRVRINQTRARRCASSA
mmetsp:Transcript_14009/g.36850  ORF Transcript_14009/g.36850 Transcript_14009/m.36850 type:complete len:276 (+) Transcript_14009:1375-2202(+)